jgi:PAS domain S-box-containing protein
MLGTEFVKRPELLNAVVDNDFIGIAVYDRDFRYRYWNRYMESLIGVAAKELIGESMFESFPFLRAHDAARSLALPLSGTPSHSVNMHFDVTKSGRAGYLEVIRTPITEADGSVSAVFSILRDTTAEMIATQFRRFLEGNDHREGMQDQVLLELGKAIELRRKSLKMSQERLSTLSGLHRTYISDIERGTRNVAVRNVLRIAHALQLPASTVLHNAESKALQSAPEKA